MDKKEKAVSEEGFAAIVQRALTAVRTEEDPHEMGRLKKWYKKYIPLTMRSYVAAYLAMEAAAKSSVHQAGKRRDEASGSKSIYTRRSETYENTDKSPRRAFIDDENAATVFVGVGKNRRVFVKDIVSLFTQTANIDRERIGLIRVLDNYSFVQLFKEDADTAISKLDGYEYRGRKLAVSYSRKKEDLTIARTAPADTAIAEDRVEEVQPAVLETQHHGDSGRSDFLV